MKIIDGNITRSKSLNKLRAVGTAALLGTVAIGAVHAETVARTTSMGNAHFGATVVNTFTDQLSGGVYLAGVITETSSRVFGVSQPTMAAKVSLTSRSSAQWTASGSTRIGNETLFRFDTQLDRSASLTSSPMVQTRIVRPNGFPFLSARVISRVNVRAAVTVSRQPLGIASLRAELNPTTETVVSFESPTGIIQAPQTLVSTSLTGTVEQLGITGVVRASAMSNIRPLHSRIALPPPWIWNIENNPVPQIFATTFHTF